MEHAELIQLAKRAARITIGDTLQDVSLRLDFHGDEAVFLRDWFYAETPQHTQGFQMVFVLNPAPPQQETPKPLQEMHISK